MACTHGLHAWLARRLREWARRLGATPLMRMTGSWFGSTSDPPNTSVWREVPRPMASSPRIIRQTPTKRHQRLELEEKGPSRCSSSLRVLRRHSLPRRRPGALRNTNFAKAARRQAALAFRSLDPLRALREPDRRRRDEERPFPLRTKNWQKNPKQPLDRKNLM